MRPLPGGPPPRQLTREEVDRTLPALRSAYDRIATAIYAVDSHPGLVFLRGAGHTGTTARVAGEVQQLLALLWAQFGALRVPLEEAEAIREGRSRPGDRELAALTQLLRQAVIELGDGDFPFDGNGAPARRVPAHELARVLESSVTGLAQLLADVDRSVGEVAARVARATDALGRVRTRAQALPADEATRLVDLAGLTTALDEVRAQALADPIEVTRGGAAARQVAAGLRDLDTRIGAAKGRLDELVRVRDQHPRLIAAARAAVDGVAATEATAARSYTEVREKIANPGLPEVPGAAAGLREQLAGLERLAAESHWTRLADGLAGLEHAAEQARAYAQRLNGAADGLLERRTELRGRLDAYRAKAARLGHAEHPALSTAYGDAHRLLYTRPCDLRAATRAVFHYQKFLADLTRKETAR